MFDKYYGSRLNYETMAASDWRSKASLKLFIYLFRICFLTKHFIVFVSHSLWSFHSLLVSAKYANILMVFL